MYQVLGITPNLIGFLIRFHQEPYRFISPLFFIVLIGFLKIEGAFLFPRLRLEAVCERLILPFKHRNRRSHLLRVQRDRK